MRDSARGDHLCVVVAGGGTAGHIEPAMALADAVRRLRPDARIVALGTERGLENRLVPARGYPLELIPPVPLPRKPTTDLLKLPLRVRDSVRRTREVLERVGADIVVGFGGYVALPAYLAARGRIPIVVHEANARAGLANKLGARFATKVAAAVPGSGLPTADIIGIPLRQSITMLDRAGLRAQARQYFGLAPDAPTLLVFGGSQGARTLNLAVAGAARALGEAGIGVLHAHGPRNTLAVQAVAGVPDGSTLQAGLAPDGSTLQAGLAPDGSTLQAGLALDGSTLQAGLAPPYVAVPYLERMDLAYAAADAVVCRSGAMTVAEVSAVGLPAVFVPLPHGNGEQALNARPVVDVGGALLVHDAEMTPQKVIETVIPLLRNPAVLAKMSTAAQGTGHREADVVLAKMVLEVVHT